MLHIVAFFIWFSVLAASHFPDHSLSLNSANFNISSLFIFFNNLLSNNNTEDNPSSGVAKRLKKKMKPSFRWLGISEQNRCGNKGGLSVSTPGHQLKGRKLSAELFSNVPEFLSSDSEKA